MVLRKISQIYLYYLLSIMNLIVNICRKARILLNSLTGRSHRGVFCYLWFIIIHMTVRIRAMLWWPNLSTDVLLFLFFATVMETHLASSGRRSRSSTSSERKISDWISSKERVVCINQKKRQLSFKTPQRFLARLTNFLMSIHCALRLTPLSKPDWAKDWQLTWSCMLYLTYDKLLYL